MPYKHLTPCERGQIEALVRAGTCKAEIARQLKRSRTTIGRELARNNAPHQAYAAERAQARYQEQRQECRRTRSLDHLPLRQYVIEKITTGWSPEQVSGRLWLDYPGQPRMRVSHETLYRQLYADESLKRILLPCLRQRRPRRRARGSRKPTRPMIQNRISIEQRPQVVQDRLRYGDWEGDTIIGRHQESAIVTLVERKSLLLKATVLPSRKAQPTADAIIQALAPLPQEWRHTITFDNGTEFAHHERIAQATQTQVYFAHPYASHERARNENTNGLLRHYLPKSTDFSTLQQTSLQRLLDELNQRPRKTLLYRTPQEIFELNTVALTA